VAFIFLLLILLSLGTVIKKRVPTEVNDLFRMNKGLQEQGYYMGDFEFKMLGIAYYLDKGHYFSGMSRLDQLHKQLKSRKGLIKVPEFRSKEAELEFYRDLQNPRTGAFMDDSYPHCTYNEVTENALLHLEALAKETGQPLRLKYPLKYLDEINTPKKLTAFLNDVFHVGRFAAKFPQTSFLFARSLAGFCNEGEEVIERNHLYKFSPEWRRALIRWFYENQDPRTGFWGPRTNKNGKLLKTDLNNTASIIKVFVTQDGNDIHREFPLRYKDRMFETTLEVLSGPMPKDAQVDEVHEWNLKMGKGISMLTRYLWKGASVENKAKAKKLMENYVRIIFEKNYISNEGAFSYYPVSKHATLDGTGNTTGGLTDMGFFSGEKQKRLWGENVIDLGTYEISGFSKADLDLTANSQGVARANSLRLYPSNPEGNKLTSGVLAITYPHKTPVLDVMDLTPKMEHWTQTTSQTMGNWVSKEAVLQELGTLNIKQVPVYEKEAFIRSANHILRKNQKIVVMAFDLLQVPRYKITFHLKCNLP